MYTLINLFFRTITLEAHESSGDEFSSEDERPSNSKDRNPQLLSVKDTTQSQQATSESFDTTISYASGSSVGSNLYTPSNSNPATPASFTPIRPNVDKNLVELLLRRVEKLIAAQDQHSIILDNILRNQLLQNNDLIERPRDFPKLPILNKAEYRAVEEFLADPDKFSYMVSPHF